MPNSTRQGCGVKSEVTFQNQVETVKKMDLSVENQSIHGDEERSCRYYNAMYGLQRRDHK